MSDSFHSKGSSGSGWPPFRTHSLNLSLAPVDGAVWRPGQAGTESHWVSPGPGKPLAAPLHEEAGGLAGSK